MACAKRSFLVVALAGILCASTGCLSLTATFNNRDLIKSGKTRDLIKNTALLGDVLGFGVPVTLFLLSEAGASSSNISSASGEALGTFAMILASPVIIVDMLLANAIHELIFGDEYHLPILKSGT